MTSSQELRDEKKEEYVPSYKPAFAMKKPEQKQSSYVPSVISGNEPRQMRRRPNRADQVNQLFEEESEVKV